MLYGELWLACLDLVALLRLAFVGHIVALLLVFFLVFTVVDAQVSIDEGRGKLVLGDSGGQ